MKYPGEIGAYTGLPIYEGITIYVPVGTRVVETPLVDKPMVVDHDTIRAYLENSAKA